MASIMRDFSEKRDFYRMQVNSEVRITDSNGNQFQGICKDLSGTGMQIQSERAFEEGAELHALLPSSNDKFPPFESQVTVLRCTPSDDGYLLGTSITEVKR